jgi:asparagine synthase (glutamine-hydrolysing)
MTLFAGAVQLQPGVALPSRFAAVLAERLSRIAEDRPTVLRGDGHALAHLDLGLLDGDTLLHSGERVSLLAGEPLIGRGAEPGADVMALHRDAVAPHDAALRAARGTFCFAHVDVASRRVWLAADKLALRPLYWAVDDGVLVFATALRMVLELLPALGEQPDLTAQTQLAALGQTQGSRSPYARIKAVEAGERLCIDRNGARSEPYFRWDDIAPVECSADAFGARLFTAFDDAVRVRLGNQRRVVAHVSGGLDSRCVAALLRAHGAEVHSMNFAPADSADLVLGRLVAERIGTRHFEHFEGGTDFWERMIAAHRAWLGKLPAHELPPRPARIWTGFAGETVLAPTNLTARIVQAMRQGQVDAAVRLYLQRNGGELSKRLFVRARRDAMAGILRASVHDELARRSSADAARRMHVYQLLNEPRGNLARHHEDLDLRRIEFTVPFCDTEVVSVALSWQIEPMLQHRFYYGWLERFPAAVRAVAWQAYPWSLPCPIPLPRQGLRVQWAEDWFHHKERRAELRRLVAQCTADMAHPRFPHELLDRHALRLACMLANWGIERYAYLLRHALVFSRHATRALPG